MQNAQKAKRKSSFRCHIQQNCQWWNMSCFSIIVLKYWKVAKSTLKHCFIINFYTLYKMSGVTSICLHTGKKGTKCKLIRNRYILQCVIWIFAMSELIGLWYIYGLVNVVLYTYSRIVVGPIFSFQVFEGLTVLACSMLQVVFFNKAI